VLPLGIIILCNEANLMSLIAQEMIDRDETPDKYEAQIGLQASWIVPLLHIAQQPSYFLLDFVPEHLS
jgi:hypothetical protein